MRDVPAGCKGFSFETCGPSTAFEFGLHGRDNANLADNLDVEMVGGRAGKYYVQLHAGCITISSRAEPALPLPICAGISSYPPPPLVVPQTTSPRPLTTVWGVRHPPPRIIGCRFHGFPTTASLFVDSTLGVFPPPSC